MAYAEGILPTTNISARMAEDHRTVMNRITPADFDHTPGWQVVRDPSGHSPLVMKNAGVANRSVDTELVFHQGLIHNNLSSFYQTAKGDRVQAYVAHVNETKPLIGRSHDETLTAGLTYEPRLKDDVASVELNHEERFADAAAWSSVVIRLNEAGAAKVSEDRKGATVEIAISNTMKGPSYALRLKGTSEEVTEVKRDDLASRGIKLPTVVFYPTGIVVLYNGTKLQIDTTPVSPHGKGRLQRNEFVATITATEAGHNLFQRRSD